MTVMKLECCWMSLIQLHPVCLLLSSFVHIPNTVCILPLSAGEECLTLETFKAGFSDFIDAIDDLVLSRIFFMFDHDKDGIISFREFLVGMSVYQRGNTEEKLRFAFMMYDMDEDGFVDKQDCFSMLKGMWKDDVTGEIRPEHAKEIIAYVDQVFDQIDLDRNGKISLDEVMTILLSKTDAEKAQELLEEHQRDMAAVESKVSEEKRRQKDALMARLEAMKAKKAVNG